MAGRSRFKESMEHFTLFLPSSLLSEIRQEVEYSVARLPKRLGSILKAVATGERNMVKSLLN